MELKEICSTIAGNHLKPGDVVECIRENSRGGSAYNNCYVGRRYVVSDVLYDKFKYIILKGVRHGHFSHFFKKVD